MRSQNGLRPVWQGNFNHLLEGDRSYPWYGLPQRVVCALVSVSFWLVARVLVMHQSHWCTSKFRALTSASISFMDWSLKGPHHSLCLLVTVVFVRSTLIASTKRWSDLRLDIKERWLAELVNCLDLSYLCLSRPSLSVQGHVRLSGEPSVRHWARSILRRVLWPLCLFFLFHFDVHILQLLFNLLQGLHEEGWSQDALLVLHSILRLSRWFVNLCVLEHRA